jgi:hypothetical protein
MAELIKKGLLLVMSEQCFDNYFMDYNFFDGKCVLFSDDMEVQSLPSSFSRLQRLVRRQSSAKDSELESSRDPF